MDNLDIDVMIKEYTAVAEMNEKRAQTEEAHMLGTYRVCQEYAQEKRQLVSWLKELKELRKERTVGRFVTNPEGNYECSKCRIAWKEMPLTEDNKPVFKACPWCGTLMEKEN